MISNFKSSGKHGDNGDLSTDMKTAVVSLRGQQMETKDVSIQWHVHGKQLCTTGRITAQLNREQSHNMSNCCLWQLVTSDGEQQGQYLLVTSKSSHSFPEPELPNKKT